MNKKLLVIALCLGATSAHACLGLRIASVPGNDERVRKIFVRNIDKTTCVVTASAVEANSDEKTEKVTVPNGGLTLKEGESATFSFQYGLVGNDDGTVSQLPLPEKEELYKLVVRGTTKAGESPTNGVIFPVALGYGPVAFAAKQGEAKLTFSRQKDVITVTNHGNHFASPRKIVVGNTVCRPLLWVEGGASKTFEGGIPCGKGLLSFSGKTVEFFETDEKSYGSI